MSPEQLPKKAGFADAAQLYGVYRDYVKHEDELINRRLSWNLTLQGFLFAAYGVSVQVLSNPNSTAQLRQHLKPLPCVFPAVGGLVAVLVLLSVMAAQASIEGLKVQWRGIASQIEDGVLEMLPGLTGAGQRFANKWGKMPQAGIPAVITVAWVVLLWIAVSA
jgi:hypothetical protein